MSCHGFDPGWRDSADIENKRHRRVRGEILDQKRLLPSRHPAFGKLVANATQDTAIRRVVIPFRMQHIHVADGDVRGFCISLAQLDDGSVVQLPDNAV